MSKSSFYYLIGADGVGKTTHVKLLFDKFKKQNGKVKYVWLRFFHCFSLPLLIYCRLMGFTNYYNVGDYTMGEHHFYKSKFVSLIYPYLIYIDIKLISYFKVNLPMLFGYSIFCDRFVFDTIVDIMVDLRSYNFYKSDLAYRLVKLIPENSHFCLLVVDEEIIKERRADLIDDPTLNLRIWLYYKLADYYDIPIVSNNGKIEEINDIITNTIGVDI